jgi:hypothetical protein
MRGCEELSAVLGDRQCCMKRAAETVVCIVSEKDHARYLLYRQMHREVLQGILEQMQ